MSVTLKVVTLKGQVLQDLQMNVNNTVTELKYAVSSRINGQKVEFMRLIYRAKPMSDEGKTLASYGICPSNKPVNIHVVSRFDGGDRNAIQEIAVQLKYVTRAKLFGVEMIEPEDEYTWNIMMRGPAKSPYAEGLFSLTFKFPQNYPYSPPAIKFNTPVFHPNVFSSGDLCWHEHDEKGSKYFADILIGAVNSLLEQPNPESAANSEAARLYSTNRNEYNRKAKALTLQHAGYR